MPRTSMTVAHFAVRLLCVLFVLIPAIGAAQYNTGSITGLIRDQQSGAIAGASIVAVHAATGLVVERTSDTHGRFVLPELPIGTYTLTVNLSGFAPFRRDDLVLGIGQALEVHVTLVVASLSDTVTVSAAPIL